MYEQIAQIRILLANVNSYIQDILHENEQLRKERESLIKQIKELKGE